MIDLTPIEIRKKKGDFPRSFRGYETTEVDIFLEIVADRLEVLVTENRALEAQIAELQSELASYRERDQALTSALVSAEAMREEIRAQAEREADLIRREAELEAEAAREAAARAVAEEEDQLRRLRARRVQGLESYRRFLERQLAEVAIMEEAVGAETSSVEGSGSVEG